MHNDVAPRGSISTGFGLRRTFSRPWLCSISWMASNI